MKKDIMTELIELAKETRSLVDEIKDSMGIEDQEEFNFLRDFFKDYNTSCSLSLAYPEELWIATAKSMGIDTEGKDRLQLAKELFSSAPPDNMEAAESTTPQKE
jgi:hypothetical protein